MKIENMTVAKYMWLQQRGYIQMTKKELIKQICRLDEGYTEVSLKRFNKANLEELLRDLQEKRMVANKVEEQDRLARQVADGKAVLAGIVLMSIVITSILLIV